MHVVDELFNCISNSIYPIPVMVLIHFYGEENIDNDTNVDIITGVYQGLILNKMITREELIENMYNVDSFIRKKYNKYRQTYDCFFHFYELFIFKRILLPETMQ